MKKSIIFITILSAMTLLVMLTFAASPDGKAPEIEKAEAAEPAVETKVSEALKQGTDTESDGSKNPGGFVVSEPGGNQGWLGDSSYGAYGENSNGNIGYLGSSAYGVHGSVPSIMDRAVFGENIASGNYGYLGSDGAGVSGINDNNNSGHLGTSLYGVVGWNFASGNSGYFASADYGAYGYADDSADKGVYGENTNGNYGYLGGSDYGVRGESYVGNFGVLGGGEYGVRGYSSLGCTGYLGTDGWGVHGVHTDGNHGSLGVHNCAVKGWAVTASSIGVEGNNVNGNYGALATEQYGVYGIHNNSYEGYLGVSYCGVRGIHQASGHWAYLGSTSWAGRFHGNVDIEGTLSKDAGSFKIDHPLDPENKYLYHSFVESPDMMNVYNGNIILDEIGEALIELPDWFEALNQDFRYQLTCIGGFAPVYISEEISGNQFKIAGGEPAMKVSWQVTGVRHDPYAEAHRIPVEEDKPQDEIGKYRNPDLYGQPETMGVDYIAEEPLEHHSDPAPAE